METDVCKECKGEGITFLGLDCEHCNGTGLQNAPEKATSNSN